MSHGGWQAEPLLSLKRLLQDCQKLWAKHLPCLGEELIGQAVRARLFATGRQLESCLKLIKRDALLCTFCLLGI